MYAENINIALRFFELTEMPSSMKHLKQVFLKLSLKYHPDKNGGSQESTEHFKVLGEHFKVLGDFFIANNTGNNDKEDSDEVETFKNYNDIKENSLSFTIHLDKSFSSWINVFTHKYGEPIVDVSGGVRWADNVFQVEGEQFKVTVTLYETTSNLHIQSSRNWFNGLYVLQVLPQLYAEVRKLNPEAIGGPRTPRPRRNATKNSGSKPQSQRGAKAIAKSKSLSCKVEELCKFVGESVKELSRHEKSVHSKRNFNAQRSMELLLEESTMEEDSVTLEEPVSAKIPEPEKPKGFDFAKYNREQVEAKEELRLAQEEIVSLKKKIVSLEDNLNVFTTGRDEAIATLESQVESLNKEKKDLSEQVLALDQEKKVLGEQVLALDREKKKVQRDADSADKLQKQNSLKREEEYNAVIKKVQVLSEENFMLKEEVRLLKAVEESDADLKEMYEETMGREKEEVSAQTDPLSSVAAVSVETRSGTEEAQTETSPQTEVVPEVGGENTAEVAGLEVGSEAEVALGKCDICAVECVGIWPYQKELREHMKEVHDKKNGSFANCHRCGFRLT